MDTKVLILAAAGATGRAVEQILTAATGVQRAADPELQDEEHNRVQGARLVLLELRAAGELVELQSAPSGVGWHQAVYARSASSIVAGQRGGAYLASLFPARRDVVVQALRVVASGRNMDTCDCSTLEGRLDREALERASDALLEQGLVEVVQPVPPRSGTHEVLQLTPAGRALLAHVLEREGV